MFWAVSPEKNGHGVPSAKCMNFVIKLKPVHFKIISFRFGVDQSNSNLSSSGTALLSSVATTCSSAARSLSCMVSWSNGNKVWRAVWSV